MQRIKVENIDRLVSAFFRTEGISIDIVYDQQLRPLWETAHAVDSEELSLAFYQDEWKQVIQPQNVQTLQDYFSASRVGRGTRLNRMKKAEIWPVFEEFRALVKQKGWKEREEAMYDALSLLKNKPEASLPHRSVIVDEAQDMGTAAFRLLRAIVPSGPNNMLIVGDPHQRIYGRKVILGRCGVEIRGRSRKLQINYRTTDETRKRATAVFAGIPTDDLDGGKDSLKDYRSLMHGEAPKIHRFENFQKEIAFIRSYLQELDKAAAQLSNVCIMVRTKQLADLYTQNLEKESIKIRRIKRSEVDNPAFPGVRMATMHRVKELQFEHVTLAGINRDILPIRYVIESAADTAAQKAFTLSERCLMHVAATRARASITVTYHGQPSELLPAH